MRFNYLLGGLWVGCVVAVGAIAPAKAADIQVTNIRVTPTEDGLELVLEASEQAGEELDARSTNSQRPQVFAVNRDKTWVADIVNTSLNLSGGNEFWQSNPVPGVASITVSQLDSNSVRVTITGTATAPSGQILRSDLQAIAFKIRSGSNLEDDGSARSVAPVAATPSNLSNVQTTPAPEVMVPSPTITIEDTLGLQPREQHAIPSLLPRAIAPPVGDIAVATASPLTDTISLDTQELIPRLVLRNAPVRDVLALLARAAGLNLAFDEPPTSDRDDSVSTPTISLDIEQEPLQDVFNYVLQLSGLEANRRGRTIFVGSQLPNAAQNRVVRSLRMNQVQVGVALNYLVGMGAESAVSRERLVTSVNAIAVALPEDVVAPPSLTQTQTTTEERLETQRVDYEDSIPPLRGLLVLGDERTNTLTLIGTPRQVELATTQLVQLDVRRRQVAVNVRIVDVDLSAIEDFSGSFSFGINDTFVQGIEAADIDGAASIRLDPGFDDAFSATLETQITNGNAKILTDPTLIVQEGQQATVALTEEVQTTSGETTFDEDGNVLTFEQDDPRAAGLTLVIEVNRIDDNGFVSLSVAPTVTAPAGQQENPDGSITTLLSSRSLQSGQLRLRDSQTLVLTGIIQDSDRTTVSKVPILGDIPILGALFRSTNRQNERREVIVLLTPQIIDDSDTSTFGYSYRPGIEVQHMLQR